MNRSSHPLGVPRARLSVLSAAGSAITAKRFSVTSDGDIAVHNYNNAKWFNVERPKVSSIRSLSRLLSELEVHYTKLVIRGEPLPHIDLSAPVRRKTSVDPEDLCAPYFRSVKNGIPWLCIDIDQLRLPRRLKRRPRNQLAVLQYAIEKLPECFHDVTCHWQFSSQYMVTDHENIRLHLWYWLDRPITDREAKRWTQIISAEYTPIDTSLYQPVQPHYTAAPIFEDSIEDPLDQRSGLLEGDTDAVAVPEIPERQRIVRTGNSIIHCAGGSCHYWISCVGDHDSGLGFHEPLLQAAWYYILEHGSDIDVDLLVDVLRDAIMNADQSLHSPSDIVDRASDAHLYGIVESALSKLQHQEPCGLIRGIAPRYPTPSNNE
jgi:hypothetical protein